ncbi:MAG: S-layer homology domain-containing protein, partial [Gallicola sp.]|nr:S-layer homology domain-containing protein [Gallicola sp.]
ITEDIEEPGDPTDPVEPEEPTDPTPTDPTRPVRPVDPPVDDDEPTITPPSREDNSYVPVDWIIGGSSSSPVVTTTPPVVPTSPVPSSMNFLDVNSSDWFYDGVKYVFDQKLMNGIDENTFDPHGTTTRAMVVTVLYIMEGSPNVSGVSKFNDVGDNEWFSDGVIWASENEIAQGISEDEFSPNSQVTREQLVTFLYRYAQYKNLNVDGRGIPDTFQDKNNVSGWAAVAMAWAIGQEIVKGNDLGNINPQGEATRAEIATIIQRFHSLIK